MFLDDKNHQKEPAHETALVQRIFDDFEAKSNLVGLFDLLLKIDRRVNPQLYKLSNQSHD